MFRSPILMYLALPEATCHRLASNTASCIRKGSSEGHSTCVDDGSDNHLLIELCNYEASAVSSWEVQPCCVHALGAVSQPTSQHTKRVDATLSVDRGRGFLNNRLHVQNCILSAVFIFVFTLILRVHLIFSHDSLPINTSFYLRNQ
jgi:hypothetical protein